MLTMCLPVWLLSSNLGHRVRSVIEIEQYYFHNYVDVILIPQILTSRNNYSHSGFPFSNKEVLLKIPVGSEFPLAAFDRYSECTI